MRVHRRLNGAVYANAVKMLAGGQYALRAQFLGDLSRPQAGHAHLENMPHYLCRRFVDHPLVFVLRVFPVPERWIGGEWYPGVATALHATVHLIAGIFGVPLVEHMLFGKVFEKWQKASIHAGLRRDGSQRTTPSKTRNGTIRQPHTLF